MKILTFFIVIATLVSCNSSKKSKQSVELKSEFSFEDYDIAKGRLGKIKLGTTIQSNTSVIHQMTVKQTPAYMFGFDGGGMAYLYSYKNEPVFALIPAYETDSIIAIAAIHEKLTNSKVIHPKMTVAEIKKIYTNTKIGLNLMMDWEEIEVERGDFTFVFMTESPTRIGIYSDLEESESVPMNYLKTKSDWITIY